MDEGFWVSVEEIHRVLRKVGASVHAINNWFDFEEDAGKIRIHRVRMKTPAVETFLEQLGRGIDLQELPESRQKIHLEFDTKTPCVSCGSTSNCVRVRGVASLCYTCLSEMVIFYEMEKQKRDSRAEEVRAKMFRVPVDFSTSANKGIIGDDWL